MIVRKNIPIKIGLYFKNDGLTSELILANAPLASALVSVGAHKFF